MLCARTACRQAIDGRRTDTTVGNLCSVLQLAEYTNYTLQRPYTTNRVHFQSVSVRSGFWDHMGRGVDNGGGSNSIAAVWIKYTARVFGDFLCQVRLRTALTSMLSSMPQLLASSLPMLPTPPPSPFPRLSISPLQVRHHGKRADTTPRETRARYRLEYDTLYLESSTRPMNHVPTCSERGWQLASMLVL